MSGADLAAEGCVARMLEERAVAGSELSEGCSVDRGGEKGNREDTDQLHGQIVGVFFTLGGDMV